VRKAETLRGRGSFQQLTRYGKRFDGEVLRCFCRWEIGAGTLVRAGFSVSARAYNAVRRNRARRLMRAAFDREHEGLACAADKAGRGLSLLFVYGGKHGREEQFSFTRVSGDMNSLCRKVIAVAEKQRP
jgi:ribonuclease P protein component